MQIKRLARLAGVLSVSAVMLVGMLGVAVADPGLNQIVVNATCKGGAEYAFVINGEGDVGHVIGTNDLVKIKRYTVTYVNARTGEFIGTQTVDNGKKVGLDGRLVSCVGTTTFNHWQLGDVTAAFNFQAMLP